MAWPKILSGDKGEPKAKPGDNPEVKPGEEVEPEKTIADQIAEAVGPLKEHITKLEGELAEAKKPKREVAKPEVASVLEDEDAAFNQRLTPILAKQLEIEARIARDDVEREYRQQGFGDLWDNNRKEIEKILSDTDLVRFDVESQRPVPHRGNPDLIRNVVDMVIGRAARKEGIRYSSKDKKFFLEDASSGEPSFISRRAETGAGLTKKQIEAAKRLGIPVEKYKEAASKLNFVQ